MDWKIKPANSGLKGELTVPPDKSISHRAIMFGSLAKGKCNITNFLKGEDCLSTLNAFRAMGIDIEDSGDVIKVEGKGLKGLEKPSGDLYLGNSGTTMRIMSGILAGQDFDVKLTGDESLSSRPMKRVVDPLVLMGADIKTLNDKFPPISIAPSSGALKAIDYKTPVASAQVKSCVLSAGLYADGVTSVTEPFQSRDHTERMLRYLAADIKTDGLTTSITGGRELEAKDISVPGDISSAAFFIVAALIVPGSDVILKNVGLNPTRDGMLKVLDRMGADIEVLDKRGDLEPVGDLRVKASALKGTTITPEEIPLLIDEVPVLLLAALTAEGITKVEGIQELKVKETDRVKTMTDNLAKLGDFDISEAENCLTIAGGCEKISSSAELESFGDHRVAMSMAVAALIADKECVIGNISCVDTSYPGFLRDLESLRTNS